MSRDLFFISSFSFFKILYVSQGISLSALFLGFPSKGKLSSLSETDEV